MFKEKFETLYTVEFYWRITIFSCVLSRRRSRCWKCGLTFLSLWIQLFWHRFAIFFAYSPLVRKRWAWVRTQRWSTWWRWSSCRTAGPSAREELRQTKYRKLGQNTDVKKGLKCVRNYSSCAAFLGWISTETWLNLTNWRVGDPILRPGLLDSWSAKGISDKNFLWRRTIFESRECCWKLLCQYSILTLGFCDDSPSI